MDGTSRIDELEQKFIENPRRYFAPLANEYRKAGNPHQAIAICRAHLGQLPGHMSGQIVYGQALFEGGEFDQARTVFENALAMDRENLVALRHLGDLALRDGETAAARQWYVKLLEFDPQDAAVIALVNGIDSGTVTPPKPAQTESPEPSAEATVAEAPETAPAPEPVSFHSEEEDNLMAEELGYPVPPPHAFVTETMAELYLAQGFRDRAVSVYRQLVEFRPEDERIRLRLSELEQSGAAPVIDRREEPDADRSPSIETPTPAEVQSPSEESGLSDGFTIDSPPSERQPDEPDPVEVPIRDELRVELEGVAAQLTVRDFFASLGRRRPSPRSNGTNGSGSAAPARDIFGGEASSGSDARAAAALAGAFGGSSSSAAAGTTAGDSAAAPGKESEEDVARFRAWLDGLTGE